MTSASTPIVTFAELLRFHRMAAGLTQEELAEKAHLSVDAISTLERGVRRTPRKETVALLADALDLSADDRAALFAAARRSSAVLVARSVEAAPLAAIKSAADHPSTGSAGIWPVARAHLTMVITLTIALLAIFGLLLSLVVPAFPWAVGLVSGALTFLLLGLVMRVRPVRRWLATQWHATRQPFTALTSVALTALVLLTTGFVSQPSLVAQGQFKPSGYDFSYVYHQPTHTGGSVTVGWAQSLETLAPNWIGKRSSWFTTSPIFQSCIVQLPDQTLGLAGWKADQCTEVPSVDNSGESADEKTTIIHIDPRAVWSDGVPLTATDFLFGQQLGADPNLTGDGLPFALMTLKPLDAHTIQIRWATSYPDYLTALAYLFPVPLHVYATGKFAGVFNPVTRAYDSALAQQLAKTPAMNTTIPVDNGPFTVQSFTPNHQVVLVRNPRFYSNFFQAPALDKITIVPAAGDFLPQLAAGLNPVPQMEDDVITRYQQGTRDLAVSLTPVNLRQTGNIPRGQIIVGSASDTIELAFNQQTIAPHAHGNGGVSIFTDRKVRQAFIEAFDRCAAVRALLGDVRCDDPNVFTDESDATAAVAAFDPTFRLPAYNPADAAKLLDAAGYHVVDGVRRNKDGVDPLRLKLVVSPGASGSKALAQRIQQDYTRNLQVGVIIDDDEIALWKPESPIQTGDFDMYLEDSQNSIDPIGRLIFDKAGPFDAATTKNKKGNPWGIIDAQATKRDQLASQTLSDAQRAVILVNLHRYFSQQYYVEPMYIQAVIALKKPTLCNFKLWPDAGSLFWNIADWYVAPRCP